MKNLNIKFLGNLLSTTLLISSLNAIQVDPETIKLINASSAPVGDAIAHLDEESLRDLLDKQNEEKGETISQSEHPVHVFSSVMASENEDEEEMINEYSNAMAAYYSTTHQAAYHKALNVSTDGVDVELEDKSIWAVHSWDASKVKKWNSLDTIVIAPNKNIFTRWSYPYKFINLDTKEVAKAKMKLLPIFNDPNVDIYVHWIDDIDYNRRLIRLEDGSIWSITSSDSNMMLKFDRYNIVIVGTNDGWFRGSCPNILLCVKNNMYIRGIVVN